ncbi:histidine protein kinase, partial [Stigmatella aurantiaca DW4/3-1]
MASVLIWVQPWLDARSREWLRLATVLVVPNLAIAVVVWRLGGVQSPLFAWFCAMPIVGVLMATGNMRAAVVGAVTSVLSALSVLVLSGQPLLSVAVWGLLVALAGVMAVQATHFYVQLQRARAQEEVNRRQAQEMLEATHRRAVEADQLAQVGRLVAGVAHEVNNPLAFIQANLHFLHEQLPRQGASLEEFVEVVRETQDGVVRIQQIVRDLTGLARGSLELGPGDLSACQLHILIVESMRLASLRLRKLAMVVEVPPEVPLVQADARRLVQVLLNLLLNAADALEEARVATPPGGAPGEHHPRVGAGGGGGQRAGLLARAPDAALHALFHHQGPGEGDGPGAGGFPSIHGELWWLVERRESALGGRALHPVLAARLNRGRSARNGVVKQQF